MRESSSEHKEAPVYLAVMSADPHEKESSPVQHGRQQHHPQPPLSSAGATESEISSSNGAGVDPEEEIAAVTQSSGLHDSLKTSMEESNDKSAFRITGVSAFDAADDLEQSKGMADSFVEESKHRGQSESSETDETRAVLVIGEGVPLPVKEQELESGNERGLLIEGAQNGPVTQPILRRFRRVNKYERGRWTIEDTLEHREAEDRSESEMRGAMGSQMSGGGQGVVGRESPFSQRKKGGEGEEMGLLHSRSSSDAGGQSTDPTHLGDHYHGDRTGSVTGAPGGGTGGGNLSRNTSVSSLTTAGDKSVDGDCSGDQLRNESESDFASLASAGLPTSAIGVSSPPQLPRHAVASFPTSSSTAVTVGSLAATSDSVEEETQSEPKSKTGVHRVEKALSHLNKELQRLVEENQEITQLKDRNRTLDERTHELEQEKQQLEDDKRALNTELTGKITSLQQQLEEMVLENQRLLQSNEQLTQEKEQVIAQYQSTPLSEESTSGNS